MLSVVLDSTEDPPDACPASWQAVLSLWPAPSRVHSAWGGKAWESLLLSPTGAQRGRGVPASPATAVLCFFFGQGGS